MSRQRIHDPSRRKGRLFDRPFERLFWRSSWRLSWRSCRSSWRRSAAAAGVGLAGLGTAVLAGCQSTATSGAGTSPQTTVTVTVTTTSPSAGETSTANPTTPTSAAPNPSGSGSPRPSATGDSGELCRLIDSARAATLLGAKPAITTPSPRQQPAGVRLVDGCYYGTSDARNSLTYNVYDVAGLGATAAAGDVAGFRQQVAGVPGAVVFPVTMGEASAGAVTSQGGTWLAQIEFAKGPRLVRVDAVRTSQALARASVEQAARELLPALS